jgi:predicted RNA-binding protein
MEPQVGHPRSYWLTVFSTKTWNEFIAAGGDVLGFRAGSARLLAKVRPGDLLLSYVTRVSRFVAVLEVESDPFVDFSPIWSDEEFPHRVLVRRVVTVDVDSGVDIHRLVDRFTWAASAPSATSWQGHVQNTLRRWDEEDGRLVLAALEASAPRSVSEPL